MKIACALVLASTAVYYCAESGNTRTGQAIRELTGAHTRLVWCRQVDGDGSDVFAEGSQLKLMAFDSDERGGERAILEKKGNYHRPMITPRGDRVVFSDLPAGKIFSVTWNGASLQELAPGEAVAVWMDPSNRAEWVYALAPGTKDRNEDRGPLFRFLLDNPSRKETVWDKAPVVPDNIQLSADGKHLGGLFPWPNAGLADLEKGSLTSVGRGCWTSLSPDDSRFLWIFDGAHRNLGIHSPGGGKRWKVNVNGIPGMEGHEVYHPRWSNHIRFLCLSGPYRAANGGDQIRAGGAEVEIFLGRFDSRLRSIEKWARVTADTQPDFYPDVWIDPASEGVVSRQIRRGGQAGTGPAESGPGGRIVIQAKLVEITPTPTLKAIAPYKQALAAYAYEVETVESGEYTQKKLLVAHWVIVDRKTLPIAKRQGGSYRLILEPYSRHGELEGERLVMTVKDFRFPLFYDVGAR